MIENQNGVYMSSVLFRRHEKVNKISTATQTLSNAEIASKIRQCHKKAIFLSIS